MYFADRTVIRRRGAAFTLVELLVSVTVVAILAMILLPAINHIRERSRIAEGISRLRQVGTGVQLYVADNDGQLPANQTVNAQGVPVAGGRWPARVYTYMGLAKNPEDATATPRDYRPFRCPTLDQHVEVNNIHGPVGAFGYNIYFTNSNNNNQYNWRRFADIEDPARLPLFGTISIFDGRGNYVSAGNTMVFNAPGTTASRYGWNGPTHQAGAAPNYNGRTLYLFADGHVAAVDNVWPWRDFIGTDFHPKGDPTLRP